MSGQSIASLMDDTKYFNRVVECVTKAKALADSEGKTYSVTGIDFVQGQRDYDDGTPKATYKSQLGQLYNKVNNTIRGITGQKDNPAWFISQTGYTYSPNPATQPLNAVELLGGNGAMGILSGNSQLFPHWAGLSVAGQRWPPDDQRQSLAGLLFCKSERPRIKSTSPVSAAGPHRIYLRRPRSPGELLR
ncbi:hypothetical protein LNQ52_27440 [Klebsiella pneumoniae subsp. pneumoniae]|nr:hypothetical protein [Klebsiella pneumoniae subsp. pneumoniae]